MVVYNIDVVSDTVCPWCYVGKKKLEQAIATYRDMHPDANDTFNINWHPFFLNPDAPAKGIDKTGYYRAKFGDKRVQQMFPRLAAVGASVGIAFKFGGLTGSSRASHRLIQLAKQAAGSGGGGGSRLQAQAQAQARVVDELFAAYFEQERDITSTEELVGCAARAGLDPAEARRWLEARGGEALVEREAAEARGAHITGVPNFRVQGRYEIGGAQDPAVFLRVFERIAALETEGEGGESLP